MWQVLGQQRVKALLNRSISRGELSHAYLFVGPSYIGKMTMAMNLAQAVNCDADEIPCGECNSCNRIESGKHPDIQIIGLAAVEKKEISIEQIKDMQNSASLPPYEGKKRIYIIDRAELLSNEAGNSLLKTLEEPLTEVIIILLASMEKKLLPTIISRCQRVDFLPVPVNLIEEVLRQQYNVPEKNADLIARISEGCPEWAILNLKDNRLMQEREQKINTIISLAQSTGRVRFSYAEELAARFSKARDEVESVLNLWINWWRDLLLIKGGRDDYIVNIDKKQVLMELAQGYTLRQACDFICRIQETIKQLQQNTNPRLALEVLMLNMP